jgi:hypothetical protein
VSEVTSMTTWTDVDPRTLSLDVLRANRTTARRQLELARMRVRLDNPAAVEELDQLRSVVEALTEELIRRYAADLSLVDNLLASTDARETASGPRPPLRAPKGGAS